MKNLGNFTNCNACRCDDAHPECCEGDVQTTLAYIRPLGELNLYCFDMPGRGELIRLALIISGIGFKEHRIPFSRWSHLKVYSEYKPWNFLFGDLPIFQHENLRLCQTNAIVEYIGEELFPYENRALTPKAAALQRMVLAIHKELQELMLDLLMEQNAEAEDELWESFPPKATRLLTDLESLAPEPGTLLHGQSLRDVSIADLCVYDLLTSALPDLQSFPVSIIPYMRVHAWSHTTGMNKRLAEYKKTSTWSV